MAAFSGEFMANFHIPDGLGIGKSVSRGFGTVKLIESLSFE
jgi:CRISPR/Cas system CSM-associated protein Csm3 (group 7 of RAMP superfamily)